MGPLAASTSASAGVVLALDAAARAAAEVSSLPEPRGPFRRHAGDLARRVKLISPLFDDIRESLAAEVSGPPPADAEKALAALRGALADTAVLLQSVNDGSKIYQAMQGEATMNEIYKLNGQFNEALNSLAYDKFGISEEVFEQVQLVHGQFQRAASNADFPDKSLLADLRSALKDKNCDSSTLRRISDKLQLKTKADMKKESVALHNMVISSGGEPDENLEEISSLLKRLTDSVATDVSPTDAAQSRLALLRNQAPIIPDEFRCPISLELMHDPVIIASGQTFERSYIQRWLDAGHKICPKTQQPLSHTSLTPNFVLKSLIAQWCETNGIDLPTTKSTSKDKKSGKGGSDFDPASINLLMYKMANGSKEEQRAAAGEVRLLAKRNVKNRISIAEAGVIPLLVDLLSSADLRTQEHAVTALLNLSIHDDNKRSIASPNAIQKIVEVLKTGSPEARENAAATLFSLSVVDENKVTIGDAGAIPPLISLLRDGSPRGKKDAATAIFNLCIFHGNKVKAVKAGIVTELLPLIRDPAGGAVDEALGILAILAGNYEGKAAIAASKPMPILLEVIRTGSARNKEYATTVLYSLCAGDPEQASTARELGAEAALAELAEAGSDRAKRKAAGLLEIIRRPEEEP